MGARLTIVAVPGNGGGPARFSRVVPHLPPDVALAPAVLPGFAGRPPEPSIRSLAGYADALRPIVGAANRPRLLLGHGIGGSIVLEYAQRFASEVDGVILHAPVGARLDRRRFPRLMALPGARTIGRQVLTASLLRPIWRRFLFRRRLPRAVLDRFFDDYRRCAAFGPLFSLVTPAWFASLRPVDAPAVLLWGADERLLGVEHMAAFRALLPRATVHVVPGWDHFPMLESPRSYARVVASAARGLAGCDPMSSA